MHNSPVIGANRRSLRVIVLCAVILVAVIVASFVPPIPQALSYHDFADSRAFFGIPNFWNVVSNVPFFIVGVIGLFVALSDHAGGLPSLRLLYGAFFVGVALVSVGSGYYHWLPNNETLVWDRLPMAIAFMILVSIVVGEHISERAGSIIVLPLAAVGIFSVWYWQHTEMLGRGDLRIYGLVQFLSLIVVALVIILFPSRLSGIGYLWAMFGGYALAKVLEEWDASVFALGHVMAGHALKHLAAAIGMYFFAVALKRRRIRSRSG